MKSTHIMNFTEFVNEGLLNKIHSKLSGGLGGYEEIRKIKELLGYFNTKAGAQVELVFDEPYVANFKYDSPTSKNELMDDYYEAPGTKVEIEGVTSADRAYNVNFVKLNSDGLNDVQSLGTLEYEDILNIYDIIKHKEYTIQLYR